MVDNRYECHQDCMCTHDSNNKCDGHCIGGTPDLEDRLEQVRIYNESN